MLFSSSMTATAVSLEMPVPSCQSYTLLLIFEDSAQGTPPLLRSNVFHPANKCLSSIYFVPDSNLETMTVRNRLKRVFSRLEDRG